MRTPFAILLCSTLIANAATVTETNYDVTGARLNTPVTFTPTNYPLALGNGIAAGPAKTIQPTNGVYSTSLLTGDYWVKVPPWPAFLIRVPDNTNTYSTHALSTNGLTAYTYTAPTDGIYLTNLSILKSNSLGKIIATTNASGIPTIEWYNSSGTKKAWIAADGTAQFASITAGNVTLTNLTAQSITNGAYQGTGDIYTTGSVSADTAISTTTLLSGGSLNIANGLALIDEGGNIYATSLGFTTTNYYYIDGTGTPYYNSNGVPQVVSLISP